MSRLHGLLRDGRSLSLELERGQASAPLAEHFEALAAGHGRTPITIAVAPVHPSARADLLAWLLGEPFRTVSSRLQSAPGLLELRLSERGFALEHSDGRRAEFDALPQFLAALDGSRGEIDAGQLALQLGIEAARPSVHLLIVESLAATASVAGLTQALISRSHLLLVACAEPVLTGTDSERISHLAEGIGAVWPVWVGDGTRWPTRELSAACGAAVQLPAQHLGSGSSLPPPFGPPFAALSGHARLAHDAQRLVQAAAALAERHDGELRQVQVRRQREERAARPDSAAPSDARMRRTFEVAKQRLQDDVTKLVRGVTESSRRSLLPDGRVQRAITDTLATLRTEDLNQERGEKSVRLSLTERFQQDLQRALRKAFREDLRQDLITLRDGLQALREQLESELEKDGTMPASLALSPPAEADVWSRLGEMVSMDVRYRGEMPKRGFFQRLGEGRRAVFGGMMILSLIGSIGGFSLRGLGALGVVFLFVFILAVTYTFKSWKREDAEKIRGEIERVREQLGNECRRLATEVQRDKQQQLAEFLEQSRRQLAQRLDDLSRDRQQAEQSELAQQREKARLRLRKLEQQLRDLQQSGPRVGRLRSDAQTLQQEAQRALREAARGSPQGAA